MLNQPLMPHQRSGAQRILTNNACGAFFWPVGCGKTRAAIEVFRALKNKTPDQKLLVVCPLSLIDTAWRDELKNTDYKSWNLRQNGKLIDADIYLINYESLRSARTRALVSKIAREYPLMCILDESSRIKSHTAITTKTLLSIRDSFNSRLILSATPSPNSELELWPQIAFIKDGILPSNFYVFRNQYFHLERGKQILHGGGNTRALFAQGFKYAISTKMREALTQRISTVCHSVNRDQVLADLPESTDQIRLVELSTEQKRVYNDLKTEFCSFIREHSIPAQNALVKLTKLRQVTGGFVLNENGISLQLDDQPPKLTELLTTLTELGQKQVIIWCEFTAELKAVQTALGEKAASIYGETKPEDRTQTLDSFARGTLLYLIAQPACVAHGLNLQFCYTQIFYSLSYSWERYTQARGRIYRKGQKNACLYIHLLARHTIDEVIYRVLTKKGDAQEIVLSILQSF